MAAVAVSPHGEVVAQASAANSTPVSDLPSDHAEQSPRVVEQRAYAVLRSLASGLRDPPVALGLTGQMHGVLLADANSEPLTALVTWQDRRANQQGPDGRTFLEQLLERCPEEALRNSGCGLSPGYGAVTLSWWKAYGGLPDAEFQCATIVDWLASRFTAKASAMDRTMAASLGVYDLRSDRWSSALIEALGLSPDWLPPVSESGALIGGLSAEAAEATGMPEGLPVSVGLGDNQAAFLGGVPPGDDILAVNIGTGGQVSWPVDEFARVEAMDTRYLPHGRFLMVGAGLSGGDAYAWVQRTAADWLSAFGVQRTNGEIYQRLNQLAADVPPDGDSLSCEPLFRGSRSRPLARGSFTGVANNNFGPGCVARAVLEGIVEGLAEFVERAGDRRAAADRIVATGNAVRENRLLREILARRFDLPVLLPVHREEAAYGAALLAGVEAGLWTSLAEGRSQIKTEPHA